MSDAMQHSVDVELKLVYICLCLSIVVTFTGGGGVFVLQCRIRRVISWAVHFSFFFPLSSILRKVLKWHKRRDLGWLMTTLVNLLSHQVKHSHWGVTTASLDQSSAALGAVQSVVLRLISSQFCKTSCRYNRYIMASSRSSVWVCVRFCCLSLSHN